MSDKRIPCISFLQIIGPIFVVLGHSLNGLSNSGAWHVFSKEWIYIFHMPLFFLISGYLLSYKGYLHGRSYKSFLAGKVTRLLLPYLFWNLLFCIPKYMAQVYIADSAPRSIIDLLIAFLFPRRNVWGHTWFLMALFLVYSATPLFEKLLDKKNAVLKAVILAVCACLYMIPIATDFLAIGDLHKDLMFFVLGCLLGQIPREKFLQLMKKQRIVFFVLATVTSAAALIWYEQSGFLHWIPCLFILLTFLSAGAGIEHMPTACQRLASNSFGIYILHWPVMIVVRIIMHQILGIGVPMTALCMSVLGWVVPIAIVESIRALPWKGIKKPLKYLLGV